VKTSLQKFGDKTVCRVNCKKAKKPIPFDEMRKNEWWKTFNKEWRKTESEIKQDRAEKYYVQYINTIK
jgi:hypothetical protein